MDEVTSLALARLHLCVSVCFEVDPKAIRFPRRAGAVLIGTRTSIIAGRTVVPDIGMQVSPRLAKKALLFGTFACAALSFVDNFYTFGRSAIDAIEHMQVVEVSLWQRWKLRL